MHNIPRETIMHAVIEIGNKYRKLGSEAQKTADSFGIFNKAAKPFMKHIPVCFGQKPKHKVSKKAINQLKIFLHGKPRLSVKPSLHPKPIRKKIATAFETGNVIWNTPENGLTEIETLYKNGKF